MALTDENNMVMPVVPMYGGNGGNNGGFGNGFGGDSWAWIILLLLLGWGNNGWGGNNGNNGGNFGAGGLYPWMNQSNQISDGFQNQLMNDNITEIRSGVTGLATQLCNCCGDIQTSLCNGFNGVTNAVTGAQNALAQQMYGNELANLERSFAAQTASTQGMTAIQAQLAQCCCDNRLATAGLDATIARENCADREALNYATRDIIASQTQGIQRILDQLCNDKIDAKNEKIADLERQLTMANLAQSQTAQNAFIAQGFANEVDQLYNRLNNCPVPTTPVYGRTPIFQCNQTPTCGCGCGCGA